MRMEPAPPEPASLARITNGFRAGFLAFLPGASVAGGLAISPLMGLAGLASARPQTVKALRRAPLGVLFLLGFFLWAALSTAWAPNPEEGQAWRLALVFFPGLLLISGAGDRRVTEAAGVAAVLVTIVMLTIEATLAMPFNRAFHPDEIDWVLARNPGRGVTVLVLIVWAALGALLARRGPLHALLFVVISAATGWLSAQFGMDANLLAFGAATFAFWIAFALPRFAIITASTVLAGWLLAAPFVTPLIFANPNFVESLPKSWAIRSEIWRFACARIAEQPWIGRGMDAARSFPDQITVRGETMRALPLHPHSASLQVWLETGAVGASLAALALVLGGWGLARKFRDNRSAAAATAATLAAMGLFANVSYGAWQEWLWAVALTAACLIASIPTSAKA
jgi:O-antigen ligase